MSYCRFGPDSDVYVYASIGGGWVTHVVGTFEDRHHVTRKACYDHLMELRSEGLQVPDHALERLELEMHDEIR